MEQLTYELPTDIKSKIPADTPTHPYISKGTVLSSIPYKGCKLPLTPKEIYNYVYTHRPERFVVIKDIQDSVRFNFFVKTEPNVYHLYNLGIVQYEDVDEFANGVAIYTSESTKYGEDLREFFTNLPEGENLYIDLALTKKIYEHRKICHDYKEFLTTELDSQVNIHVEGYDDYGAFFDYLLMYMYLQYNRAILFGKNVEMPYLEGLQFINMEIVDPQALSEWKDLYPLYTKDIEDWINK